MFSLSIPSVIASLSIKTIVSFGVMMLPWQNVVSPCTKKKTPIIGVRGRILNSRRGITHAILPTRKHLSLSLLSPNLFRSPRCHDQMHRSKLLLRCSLLTLARDPKIILPRTSTLCLPSLFLLCVCVSVFFY